MTDRSYGRSALFAVLAIAFAAMFSSAQPVSAQETLGDAPSPSWRILKRDAQGRPILLDKGTGKEFEVEQTETPDATTPDETQIKKIDPGSLMRGQLLLVNPPRNIRSQLEKDGFSILEEIRLFSMDAEVWRVSIPPTMSEKGALRKLKKDFPDLLVDTNQTFDLSAGNVGADFSRGFVGWGPVSPSCGAGMRIGMIDGAVDKKTASLRKQRVNYEGFNAKDRKPAGEAHGTAVAAMLVGRPEGDEKNIGGLLPGATLYSAGIFEIRGGKEVGNLGNMMKAADWLLKNRVSVVNMSIAGGGNGVMTFVLNKMLEEGVVVVAAAGNNGPRAEPAWPAAHPKVIAVTAIDNQLKIYEQANRGDYVDFAAPGVNLVTHVPSGLKLQSGTSFASPFITAMVAIHLDAGFPSDPDQLRGSLRRYTKDLGQTGKDDAFGWGLVRLKPSCR